MKRLFLTFCSAAFLFAACNNDKTAEKTASESTSEPATAKTDDNAKKEQAWIPYDVAAANKAMEDAAKLGEPHKMLAKSNGTWSAEMSYWQKDGDSAMKMSGTQVTSSILDGHYQQSTYSGDMGGMPFKGISTLGYDNVSKEYVSTWIDNMGTSIMTMKGTWDAATNSLNLTGKQKNPANGLECTEREVYKIVDDHTHVLEMYGPDPQTGKEYKMMEVKYTRKK
jgi:hypothetical protein